MSLKRVLHALKLCISLIVGILAGMPIRFAELLGQLFPGNAWGCRVRGLCYRPFLRRCGRNFQVALNAKLEHLGNIEIGDNVYVGHGAWLSGLRGGICLEDEVMIGPYVTMVSSNHTFSGGSARFCEGAGAPILIGAGTWIAAHVTVTAGVTVGPSSLLAAGAVVTKDVPEGTIVAGVPAKEIGSTIQSNNTPPT